MNLTESDAMVEAIERRIRPEDNEYNRGFNNGLRAAHQVCLTAALAAMREALEPFALLQVPQNKGAGSGNYWIKFDDIERARMWHGAWSALKSSHKDTHNE